MDRDRVATLEPALAPVQDRIAGAIYAPSDESGDAHLFTGALAAFCRDKMGVRLAFETTIRGIEVLGDRIERLVTDKGDVYVMMGIKDHQPGREVLIDKMAETVTVEGTLVKKGGVQVVYVSSVK